MPLHPDFKNELKRRIDYMDMFNDYDPQTAQDYRADNSKKRDHEHMLGKFFRGESPHTFLMVDDNE